MVKEQITLIMGIITEENIREVNLTDKGFILGQMEALMKVAS